MDNPTLPTERLISEEAHRVAYKAIKMLGEALDATPFNYERVTVLAEACHAGECLMTDLEEKDPDFT